MAILLNDVWYSMVKDYGYVNSRVRWVKFKFSSVKVYVVLRYDPNEADEKKGRCVGMIWTGFWIK